MAAATVFIHNHISREGAESDEAEKSTPAITVDCNEKNATVNKEKIELKDEVTEVVTEEVKQSGSGIVEAEISKCENNLDGANNNKKDEAIPPLKPSCGELVTTEEKSSTLISSNTNISSVNITEVSQESSVSICKTDDKLTGHNDESSSEEENSIRENNNNNTKKESYPDIKSKRKTLLKIEKLTDSDSRSRNKMRRRALSPPSSSDEENLYIGWIAYPASITSLRRAKRDKSRHKVWRRAANCIFYPITKVCQKCIKTKVEAVVEE